MSTNAPSPRKTSVNIAPVSGFDRYFSITARGSSVRQELIAGVTTFLAMVYSIIVVPNMLGAA
ncbi:MAG: hypothetical protein ACRC55_07890, partial [Plesiomonas sp.]